MGGLRTDIQEDGLMKNRIKVYVAGAYSADNVLSVLQNIGRGEKACAELFRLGFAPFCPWSDRIFITHNPSAHFTIEDFYEYSITWLEVSEVMLVLPSHSESGGTVKEIARANELKIPVVYSIDELVKFCAYFK
jgi:hypothetical protein